MDPLTPPPVRRIALDREPYIARPAPPRNGATPATGMLAAQRHLVRRPAEDMAMLRGGMLGRGLRSGAERAGFEPAVGFDPYAALAKRCFRPLSHLSGGCGRVRVLILARPVSADNGPASKTV